MATYILRIFLIGCTLLRIFLIVWRFQMRSALSLLLISYVVERLLGGSNSRLAGVESDDVQLVLSHKCANYSVLVFYL